MIQINNKLVVKIIYAKRYDFVDQRSGRRVKGCRLDYFVYPEDRNYVKNEDEKGIAITSTTADYDIFSKITRSSSDIPNYFILEFSMRPDSSGKPRLEVVDVRELSEEEEKQLEKNAQ